MGFVGCVAWCGVAVYMRRAAFEKAARELRRAKQAKSTGRARKAEGKPVEARKRQEVNDGAVRSWWPW